MERRGYQRICVDAEGIFYIRTKSEFKGDFFGIIRDVSESGICAEIDLKANEKVVSKIDVGSEISFEAIEEYKFYDDLIKNVFAGKLKIVRKIIEGDKVVLGCEVYPPKGTYDEYVKNRKVSIYISQLRKIL